MATMREPGGNNTYGDNSFKNSGLSNDYNNGSIAIDISSVFGDQGINFFGEYHSNLYINVNGCISFGSSFGVHRDPNEQNAHDLYQQLSVPMLMPFYADWALQNGDIYWDLDPQTGELIITYKNISHPELNMYEGQGSNDFQVVLGNLGGGDFTVEYIYGNIELFHGEGDAYYARAGYVSPADPGKQGGNPTFLDGYTDEQALLSYETKDHGSGDPDGTYKIKFVNGQPVNTDGTESPISPNSSGSTALVVDGTDGDDVIDVNYTGDPEGDKVDNNDGNPNSATGNDDVIVAKGGNDTILGGEGNDSIGGDLSNIEAFEAASKPNLLTNGSFEDGTGEGSAASGSQWGITSGEVTGWTGTSRTYNWDSDKQGLLADPTDASDGESFIGISANWATEYIQQTLATPLSAGGVYTLKFDGIAIRHLGWFNLVDNPDPTTLVIKDQSGVELGRVDVTYGTTEKGDWQEYTVRLDVGNTDVTTLSIWAQHDNGTTTNNNADAGVLLDNLVLTEGDSSWDADSLGNDSIDGQAGNDVIFGNQGDDTISGGADDDRLDGGSGDDVLSGDAGNDTIFGASGKDTITGGTGDDLIYGGGSRDTFVYNDGDGADTIADFGTGDLLPSGTLGNHDLVDLSDFYNLGTLAAVNEQLPESEQFGTQLEMLRHDAEDGVLDGTLRGQDFSSVIGNINLTLQDGSGQSVTGDDLHLANTNVGHEFYINQTEAGGQSQSNATMLSNGNYVVTWFDSHTVSIMAREYEWDGTPVTDEFALVSRGDSVALDGGKVGQIGEPSAGAVNLPITELGDGTYIVGFYGWINQSTIVDENGEPYTAPYISSYNGPYGVKVTPAVTSDASPVVSDPIWFQNDHGYDGAAAGTRSDGFFDVAEAGDNGEFVTIGWRGHGNNDGLDTSKRISVQKFDENGNLEAQQSFGSLPGGFQVHENSHTNIKIAQMEDGTYVVYLSARPVGSSDTEAYPYLFRLDENLEPVNGSLVSIGNGYFHANQVELEYSDDNTLVVYGSQKSPEQNQSAYFFKYNTDTGKLEQTHSYFASSNTGKITDLKKLDDGTYSAIVNNPAANNPTYTKFILPENGTTAVRDTSEDSSAAYSGVGGTDTTSQIYGALLLNKQTGEVTSIHDTLFQNPYGNQDSQYEYDVIRGQTVQVSTPPDKIVSGTDGDDIIDVDYTGDPDGDKVDNNDGNPTSPSGDADLIEAGAGNDIIKSGLDNDTIIAGQGNDTIFGGAGDDSISGGEGDDEFVYAAGDGADTITDFGVGQTGGVNDGDDTNNDLVDLSAFYNETTLAEVNSAGGEFDSALSMLKADAADGTIDGVINGTDYSTEIGDVNLTLLDGAGSSIDSSVLTYETTRVVCFTKGTLIKTIDGERPVDELAQGDLVWTKDGGYQPIRWIGHTKLGSDVLNDNENLRPIRIKAGALGLGRPARDLIVSPQHRVLVSSRIARRMTSEDEVLVGAKFLLQLNGIDVANDMDEVTYVHFMFDQHEIVQSEGAETESLFTGPEALKSVPAEAREEILSIFPELMHAELSETPPARMLLSGRQGRKLAQRHKANRRQVLEPTFPK